LAGTVAVVVATAVNFVRLLIVSCRTDRVPRIFAGAHAAPVGRMPSLK